MIVQLAFSVVKSSRPRTLFRPLDGLLLLDKPPGLSSNQALQRVRHIFRAEKAGHTGSLDPLATGLLPVCFGEATKIAGLLLGQNKAYRAEITLGITTDSDDSDGQTLLIRPIPALTSEAISAVSPPFIGRIQQRPPIYSALKQGGEPLYAKARRGEAIDVPEREVQIESIRVLDFSGTRLTLEVVCGSGTYIRSLARDLGEVLGCGAHITALRRLWVEPFRTPKMFTLEQLQTLAADNEAALDACLLPIEAGLIDWPRVDLPSEAVQRLGRGQTVALPESTLLGSVAMYDPQGRCLGLGDIDSAQTLRPKRLFVWAAEAAKPVISDITFAHEPTE